MNHSLEKTHTYVHTELCTNTHLCFVSKLLNLLFYASLALQLHRSRLNLQRLHLRQQNQMFMVMLIVVMMIEIFSYSLSVQALHHLRSPSPLSGTSE